jgi:ADP-ribose pyrophosphatase YjhB (NUDIX family)
VKRISIHYSKTDTKYVPYTFLRKHEIAILTEEKLSMNHPPGFIPDELYNQIFSHVPRLCVDLVVRDDTMSKVLLIRRAIPPYENQWHLPGGMIRFKETLADAVSRIAQKEFALEATVDRLIGYCEIMDDDLGPDKPRHSVSIVVSVLTSGVPQVTRESREVRFFTALPPVSEIHPYHGTFLTQHDILC